MRRGFTPTPIIRLRDSKYKLVWGFTLVEIMIVVGIIIVLIMLAVPNILRSRVNANEGAALGNLRAVNNACQLYYLNKETYPGTLSELIEPESNPPYIDHTLATGRKQSYEFVYDLVTPDHFTVNANPTTTGLLKGRYFYMDESGVIKVNASGPAGPNDEIVG